MEDEDSDNRGSVLGELIESEDEQNYIDTLAKKKAEDIYNKLAINEKIINQKEISIGPLNTIPVKKKQKREERRLTAGKGWYYT